MLFSREQSPGFFDSVAAMCVRAGFSPRVRHTAREAQTVVRLVGLGLGVSLVSESLNTEQSAPNVCFRPLADPTIAIDYCLVSKESASELVLKAAAITRRAAAPRGARARKR